METLLFILLILFGLLLLIEFVLVGRHFWFKYRLRKVGKNAAKEPEKTLL